MDDVLMTRLDEDSIKEAICNLNSRTNTELWQAILASIRDTNHETEL